MGLETGGKRAVRTKAICLLVCLATVGCNAASPTELESINAASLQGRFLLTFSSSTCSIKGIELSFAQFREGGALPEFIRLFGSWQEFEDNFSGDLVGRLRRDTGEVRFDLIPDVRYLEGIFLDNDNIALGYTDLSLGYTARVKGGRI